MTGGDASPDRAGSVGASNGDVSSLGPALPSGAGSAVRPAARPGERPGEVMRGIVGNEFAEVEVVVERRGRVSRLLVRDIVSGVERYVDPIVLEALVFMSDDRMAELAEPDLIVDDHDR